MSMERFSQKLSRVAQTVEPSRILELTARAKRLKDEGFDPAPHFAARSIPSRAAFEDCLKGLQDEVGCTAVVALGESVHTSGGYYRAKHRLFRYLVEELGFRAFAFESPWIDAELVADYVETCEGDAVSSVTEGLFSVWGSEEVLDLVTWMCGHNRAHPDDPVAFWGFDIQQPWGDGERLLSYVWQAIPDRADFVSGIERCNGVGYGSADEYFDDPTSRSVTNEDHLACLETLLSLETYLTDHEAELAAQTSAEALAWVRINIIGLRAWEFMTYHTQWSQPGVTETRDRAMADVFMAIRRLRNPDDRVAIWAHNFHITYEGREVGGDWGNTRTMGSHLRAALGDDYFALGLVGFSVSTNWPGVAVGEHTRPGNDLHVEYRLHHEVGRDYLLVDLTFPGTDEPFLVPGNNSLINAAWMVPEDQFGALFYLDVSPMMNALRW